MAFGGDGARCDGQFAVQVQRVGNPPNVPQLQEDAPTGVMDGLGDVGPAANLFVGPDAWGVRVANAQRGNRSGFAEDQAC